MLNVAREEEIAYLKEVADEIGRESEDMIKRIRDEEVYIFETKKYMHDKVYDMDPTEVLQNRQILEGMVDSAYNMLTKSNRLKKLSGSPYFGRVSFKYKDCGEREKIKNGGIIDDEGNLQVYIGIHSYLRGMKNIIYDWRAPISSIFYDFEKGQVHFTAPKGKIEGEVNLKRQYKIQGGKLEYMIDSALKIDDEILQEQLSKATSDKMKNIVATIQREQNAIIRDEESDVLIIQGVAGSGKTSIAMHRIAYILYRLKDKIYSENMMIISPNKVFSDYISNVLPELGEEQILQITFEDIAEHELEGIAEFQPMYAQIADLLENDDAELKKRIKFKSSISFLEEMEAYIEEIEINNFTAKDFTYEYDEKPYELPASYIKSRYEAFKRYAVKRRLDLIIEDITEKLIDFYNIKKSKLRNAYIRNSVYGMQKEQNLLKLYGMMYKFMNAENMYIYNKNELSHDDVAPLLYLKNALYGADKFLYIKHLLIDEMQDYTPVHYAFFNKLFVCRKTVLGDISQLVNPYSGGGTKDGIAEVLGRDEKARVRTMTLTKSYRSTQEISEFAGRIIGSEGIEVVERHGEAPEIVKYTSEDKSYDILGYIKKYTDDGYKSIGILCKTEKQSKQIYELIKRVTDEEITHQTAESDKFDNRLLVSTAYLAKGLEFDCVIIPDADAENYRTEIDRQMLYISATRGLHRLVLLYGGDPTEMLKAHMH